MKFQGSYESGYNQWGSSQTSGSARTGSFKTVFNSSTPFVFRLPCLCKGSVTFTIWFRTSLPSPSLTATLRVMDGTTVLNSVDVVFVDSTYIMASISATYTTAPTNPFVDVKCQAVSGNICWADDYSITFTPAEPENVYYAAAMNSTTIRNTAGFFNDYPTSVIWANTIAKRFTEQSAPVTTRGLQLASNPGATNSIFCVVDCFSGKKSKFSIDGYINTGFGTLPTSIKLRMRKFTDGTIFAEKLTNFPAGADADNVLGNGTIQCVPDYTGEIVLEVENVGPASGAQSSFVNLRNYLYTSSPPTDVFFNDSGTWKPSTRYQNDGGIWKPVTQSYNDNGVWKQV